jgi:hypothetical protein
MPCMFSGLLSEVTGSCRMIAVRFPAHIVINLLYEFISIYRLIFLSNTSKSVRGLKHIFPQNRSRCCGTARVLPHCASGTANVFSSRHMLSLTHTLVRGPSENLAYRELPVRHRANSKYGQLVLFLFRIWQNSIITKGLLDSMFLHR